MATRIKICGITRESDALAASEAGADAIGMVYYPKSPRAVNLAQAQRISRVIPPFISTVVLFVNPTAGEVRAVISKVQPDLLQFHGDETSKFCLQFERPYIKAVRAKSAAYLEQQFTAHSDCRGYLVDTYVEGVAGGTGKRFDWALLEGLPTDKLILAGGLDASNVSQAITTVNPCAVDVSGGVEMSKGIKDASKMAAFISAVRAVENQYE